MLWTALAASRTMAACSLTRTPRLALAGADVFVLDAPFDDDRQEVISGTIARADGCLVVLTNDLVVVPRTPTGYPDHRYRPWGIGDDRSRRAAAVR